MRHQATLTLLAFSLSAVLAAEGFKPLRGPYMGQEADGVPRIFLPGKISSGHDEGCGASFRRDDGSWDKPRNLGPQVNSSAEENRPSPTLDGRHFLFTSNRVAEAALPPGVPPARSMPGNGSRDIYWMTSDFLDELRSADGGR